MSWQAADGAVPVQCFDADPEDMGPSPAAVDDVGMDLWEGRHEHLAPPPLARRRGAGNPPRRRARRLPAAHSPRLIRGWTTSSSVAAKVNALDLPGPRKDP
ncbi:hypothetical protein GCM10010344_15870 [Streptomyces bluensis]|nr:hypothetical protein GCM10010344_15870 [Streptomyces bluensis]